MKRLLLALCALLIVDSASVLLAQPGRPPRGGGPDFTSTPLAKDDAEQKILSVLEEMNENQRRGSMSVPREDGRLLRILAESIGHLDSICP